MSWRFVVLMALLPFSVRATTVGPPLSGTITPVNNTAGEIHTDPHLSGDLAVYTTDVSAATNIHYQNLATQVDSVVPNPAGRDFLADVFGTKLVFSRGSFGVEGAITLFDTATGGPVTTLDGTPNSARDSVSIGGNTVAWQDRTPNLMNASMVVYDLTTGTATTLSTDPTMTNWTPAVSPDGNTVVWVQCLSNSTSGDVMAAVRVAGVWTTTRLTTSGDASHPDTNGQVVTYARGQAGINGSVDWQPVGGGPEQRIALAGTQVNPSISGNWIVFDNYSSLTASDIWVYDLSTDTAYQVTNTPQQETLADISVSASGLIRVVWQAFENSQSDIYAFSFQAPSACLPAAAPGCARPLLASIQLTTPVSPPYAYASTAFAATPTNAGLLCVENGAGGTKATYGFATVNLQPGVTPLDFSTSQSTIVKSVVLQSHNLLWGTIAGQPGTAFRASVYGADPCAPAQ